MRIWITTDTHLSHRRMIEFGRPEDYEDRIFNSLTPIKEDDVFLHLGDVCIGQDDYNHRRLLEAVPCKKWLVKGNHDRKSNSWYLERGWDFIGEKIQLRYMAKNILFSHVPSQIANGVDFNVHGHLHDNHHRTEDYPFMSEKNILIALELNNYQLTLLDTLVDENIRKTKTGN